MSIALWRPLNPKPEAPKPGVSGGFPIFDQGHLGSCTANALAAAFHFTLHKMEVENNKDFGFRHLGFADGDSAQQGLSFVC